MEGNQVPAGNMWRLIGATAVVLAASLPMSGCAHPEVVGTDEGESARPSQSHDDSVLPSYDEDDLSRWQQENLDAAQRELGIVDPPDTHLVRYVTQEEWASAQVDCLTEAGFAAVESGGGMDLTRVPDEQKGPNSPLHRALYACQAEYPVDPRYSVAPNRAQLDVMYSYFVDDLIPCLQGEGVDALDEPPSRSKFIDDSATEGRVVWSPYADAYFMTITSEQWEQLNAVCPSQTPLDRLWN